MIKLEMVIFSFDCRIVITYYDCFLESVTVQCSRALQHVVSCSTKRSIVSCTIVLS